MEKNRYDKGVKYFSMVSWKPWFRPWTLDPDFLTGLAGDIDK